MDAASPTCEPRSQHLLEAPLAADHRAVPGGGLGADRQASFHFAAVGRKSGVQNDVEKILFHASTIHCRLDELAHQVTNDYSGRELTIVAVLSGSVMFTADLLRRLPLPLKLDCISVASYHGATESSGVVKFGQLTMPDVHGRDVLVLDDILDSGRTLYAIRRKLETEASPLSVKVCVLLRKRKQRAAEVDADYVGFDIADEFVVGYGLDYQGRYRNLPFIGVLKPECIST
jgi:hypoxanthine phosphoribosyltransferase